MASVELFEFLLSGTYYRYTSGSVAVVKGAATFNSAPIQRSPIIHSDDLNRTRVTVTVLRDNAFAAAALLNPNPASITIFGEYAGGTWATIWKGRAVSQTRSGSEVVIETQSVLSLLARRGKSRKYQILCPYTVFDEDCGLDGDLFKFTGTVDGIAGTAITVNGLSAEDDQYYRGGFVKFGSYEYRTITDHQGNVIVIDRAVSGLVVTMAAEVFPGCALNETDCNDKFDNEDNYGGFPWLSNNPFTRFGPKKVRR